MTDRKQTEIKAKRKQHLEAFNVVTQIMRARPTDPKKADMSNTIRKQFSNLLLELKEVQDSQIKKGEELRMTHGQYDEQKNDYTVKANQTNEYKKFNEAYEKWLEGEVAVKLNNRPDYTALCANEIVLDPMQLMVLDPYMANLD